MVDSDLSQEHELHERVAKSLKYCYNDLRQDYTSKMAKKNFFFFNIFNKFFNSYIITVQNLVAIACFIAKI